MQHLVVLPTILYLLNLGSTPGPLAYCSPELYDHTDGWTCNSHKLPMVKCVPGNCSIL